MNIATHPVAPEKVMALLDGELSAADAQSVSTHVDHCAECAQLAEQLRSTSQSLSGWRVPDIPTKLENSITDLVGKTGAGYKIGRASILPRASFWTRKQWVIVGGGAVVALLFVSANFMPKLLRSRQVVTKTVPEIVAYEQKQHMTREGSAGKAGVYKRWIAPEKQSSVTGRQTVTLSDPVEQKPPGAAADSNGIFHGLGDRAENSFSVDGQPITDQQSKVFSAPMIARTVSLSIVVKDLAASRSSLDAILARHRGYSAQLSVSTPEDAARSLQASLRIPAPELSSAVADLKTLGRVENESQSGEEVTHQHADLIARLKNARDTEQRFREILQQRTGNVAEVLQVEEGIARVRGDIERMEAEQKALEHRVDFSTIELQLTEEYKAQLNPPVPAVSTRMHNAFVAGYHNATETIFGIALFFAEYGPALLIWLVILGLPVIFVWRRYRRGLTNA